jgi:hypothetical protein
MESMAVSMKSMADMCRTMMEKEAIYKPYILIAATVVGTLVTIALGLFVVLEIQWIRLCSLRIRAEKAK